MTLAILCLPAVGAQLREREPAEESEAVFVDEDEDLLPETQYVFNPIQARRDLRIGNFYAKKGSHRAAVGRYLEATKWNPRYAEAYLRLGRSREKLNQHAEALDAYRKYLELKPSGGKAKEIRKQVEQLRKLVEAPPVAEGTAENDRP